jgi:hypothetical protein
MKNIKNLAALLGGLASDWRERLRSKRKGGLFAFLSPGGLGLFSVPLQRADRPKEKQASFIFAWHLHSMHHDHHYAIPRGSALMITTPSHREMFKDCTKVTRAGPDSTCGPTVAPRGDRRWCTRPARCLGDSGGERASISPQGQHCSPGTIGS